MTAEPITDAAPARRTAPSAPPASAPASVAVSASVAALASVAAPASAAGRAPAHLDAVDVVRVSTVALVLSVHAVAQQPGGVGLAAGLVLIVMHVSREVFFLLTAFVLAYSYRDRAPARWTDFWRRRYLLIGVPYLVWTLIYALADGQRLMPLGPALRALGTDVLTGAARYHLYFLLVTMQMYLVFPVLRALVRRTRRYHGLVLATAALYQLGCYAAVQSHVTAGPLAPWLRDPSPFLLSYLGFVVAGAIAATHAERLQEWTGRHARLVGWCCAGAVALGVAVFLVQVYPLGRAPVPASDVFQPVVVVESVAIAWTFLALGVAWRARGARYRRIVRSVSDASFGVYLAHPLLLQGLLAASAASGLTTAAARLPGPLVTAVAVLVAVPLLYLSCWAGMALLRRTPLSLPLSGRARRNPAPGRSRTTPATVPAS